MSRPAADGTLRVAYQVLLPRAALADTAQIDDYVGRVAEDLPRLGDVPDPARWVTVAETVQVDWRAVQLPKLDDEGRVQVVGRGGPWQRGTPLPSWAMGALLRVVGRARRR